MAATTTTTTGLLDLLRPEVAAVVEAEYLVAPLAGGESEDWRAYADAKRAIGAACGCDRRQYDMAIRAYLELVGL